uniref:Uncharacterized protein n=1 Tax=Paramormyrops kingsleyae TaxID=1676925 RepID=A0A3B3QY77_9TELE
MLNLFLQSTGMLSSIYCENFPVHGVIVLLLAAQVTSVYSHGCFNLLLGQFHSVVEHLEKLLRLLILSEPAEE